MARKQEDTLTEKEYITLLVVLMIILTVVAAILMNAFGYLPLNSQAVGRISNVLAFPDEALQGQMVLVRVGIYNDGQEGVIWCKWYNSDTGNLLAEDTINLPEGAGGSLAESLQVPFDQTGYFNVRAEVGHDEVTDDMGEVQVSIVYVSTSVHINVLDDETSNPIYDAEVGLGAETQHTSYSGEVTFEVTPGEYSLMISHVDYWTFSPDELITVGLQDLEFTYRLDPFTQPVQEHDVTLYVFDSQTATILTGATVMCNGETKTTDVEGKTVFVLESGSYVATASKTGFQTNSKPFEVPDITSTIIYLTPSLPDEPGDYNLLVEVYDAVTNQPILDAAVIIGDTEKLTNEYGTTTFTLAGDGATYSATASKTGYTSSTKTVTITDEDASLVFYLTMVSGDGGDEDQPAETPGFELLTLVAALGITFVLLKRRKK